MYIHILWLSCLRVEDWSKGKHSSLFELKDHLFREPRIADHTHSLRINFSNELLDNWHHVHSTAGVGVNEKWVWVELVYKAEDIWAVRLTRISRLPEDSQLRAMLLAQKRETWPHSRSRGNHYHSAKNPHYVDKAVHEHSPLPKLGWFLIDTLGCPIACLRYYAGKARTIGIGESCEAVPILERMVGEC